MVITFLKGFSYLRQPWQWPLNQTGNNGNNNPKNQQTVSSVPIPPPPPPPPIKHLTSSPATRTFNRQDQLLSIDASFRDEPLHHPGDIFSRRPRSPDEPAFLSNQFRDSEKSFQPSYLPSHLQSNGNPTPQERRSLMGRQHSGERNVEQQQQQTIPHHLYPGPTSLHPVQEVREEEDDLGDLFPNFHIKSLPRNNDRRRHSKRDVTLKRTLPHRNRYLSRLVSMQYLLLHVSISVCLLRISGE